MGESKMPDSTNPLYAAIIMGSIQLTDDLREFTEKVIKNHTPIEIISNEDVEEIKNIIKKAVNSMTDNTKEGELKLMINLLERLSKEKH